MQLGSLAAAGNSVSSACQQFILWLVGGPALNQAQAGPTGARPPSLQGEHHQLAGTKLRGPLERDATPLATSHCSQVGSQVIQI